MANFLKSLFVKGIEIDPAGATNAQVLSYNGTKFVPAAASGGGGGASTLDGLTDVVITTPATTQYLRYNGTNFVNATIIAGDVPTLNQNTTGNAATVTTNANLTGDVTSVGNATTLTNAPVIAKVLTGYVSGSGTVAATDTILQAIQKLNGNDATNANLTGDVTSVGNATTLTNAPVIAKVLTGYVLGTGAVAATDSILQAFQKKADLASPTFTGTVTVPTPTNSTDAVTKAYADAITQSLDIKDSVRVASTANIDVASALINGSTIDGVVVATGDRVLLKNQTTTTQNGIYVVVASGAASRSTDANTSAKVTSGMYVFVSEGTVSADMGYVLTTNDTITLGTTSLSFTQFSGAGQITASTGLSKSGNTLSLANTAVTPASYTNASITVDAQGRLTAASSGASQVTAVTGTSPVVSSGGTTPVMSLAASYGDALNPYAAKTAAFVLAGPTTGTATAPAFRALVATDIPTLNQSTTGSAATLTNTRTLWGQNFNGSANVSGALTGVGTVALSGATSGTTTVQASAVAGTTTITLPAVTGTVVTTGDTGSITSTMIFDGTILNADINASAAIAASKLLGVQLSQSGNNNSTTFSTGSPTGGSDGDIWFKYV